MQSNEENSQGGPSALSQRGTVSDSTTDGIPRFQGMNEDSNTGFSDGDPAAFDSDSNQTFEPQAYNTTGQHGSTDFSALNQELQK